MSEVTKTTKEVIEVVTTALQPLADKLGTTAQYVWGLQVKQAYVDGFVALGGLMFGIVLCLLSFLLVKHLNKEEYIEIADFIFFLISCCFATGLGFILVNFSTVLNCLVNPEYYALQQLIKLVK